MKKNILVMSISLLFTVLVWFSMVTNVKQGIPFSDASIFEYFGYAMNRGELMYANLFDHKGPVVFLMNYLGYLIGGALGIKFLYLFCTLLFFIASYKISKLFTGNKQTILTLAIIFIIYEYFFDGGWSLEGFILPFLTYSLYIFLKLFIQNDVRKTDIIISGAFFSIVFFTKANMIGIWLVFCFYVLIDFILKKAYRELFSLIGLFFVGILIPTIPLCLYLLSKGIFVEMVYQSIGINFIYTTEANNLSMYEIIRWYILQANFLSLNLIMLFSLIPLWKKFGIKSIFYHFVFIICLVLALISKRKYGHYILVMLPILIPYISYLFQSIAKKMSFKEFLVLFLGFMIVYQNDVKFIMKSMSTRYQNNAEKQQQVANYIKKNTSINDRIYTHRQNGTIYLYSERLSSTKFFFIPAVTDDRVIIDEFKKSIKENPPIYIVFDTEWDYGKRTDSFIKDYIKENYYLEKQVDTAMIYRKGGE